MINFATVWSQLKAEWAGRSDEERRSASSGFEDAIEMDEVDDFGIPLGGMLDEETSKWISPAELTRMAEDYAIDALAFSDLCIARLDPSDPIHALDWEEV